MDWFVTGAVAVLSAMAGFWSGRSLSWQNLEAQSALAVPKEAPEEKYTGGQYKKISKYREIASPATGEMSLSEEDGKKMVCIRTGDGLVYAPVSGKIVHLYPMGISMVVQSDFGARFLLRAGKPADDLCSAYYRCRVMENEVVRKGTLLMEYAPEDICKNGGDGAVFLSMENEEDMRMEIFNFRETENSHTHIKAGEVILRVACDTHSESSDTHF